MTSAIDGRKLLALYPALGGLPDSLLANLLLPNATMHIEAGTRIFAERQPCVGFPLVVEGSVKVVKYSSSGRELLLYRVVPGSPCIISTGCLLGDSDYGACGIAESATTLTILPKLEFNRQLVAHAPFREFVFRLFAERISGLMQLVEEVAFARLDQRLAKLLVARNDDVLGRCVSDCRNDCGLPARVGLHRHRAAGDGPRWLVSALSDRRPGQLPDEAIRQQAGD
jgi:CRP/FNR family transcriptional regulator, anaerobic regulatory protein